MWRRARRALARVLRRATFRDARAFAKRAVAESAAARQRTAAALAEARRVDRDPLGRRFDEALRGRP